MTTRRLALSLLLLLVVPAQSAAAAGAPLPSRYSGKVGAVAPGGTERFITRRAGTNTIVTVVRRGSRQVLRSALIAGRWSIPAVTLDGATTGLSADGGTLVLASPSRDYPPSITRLALLDARSLTVRRQITLPGFFTVDAIAPDGGRAFVVQYASDDVLDYRVRALDTATGRLESRDVVDPRSPDEQMGGLPLTRAMRGDGRWAYTLYSGGDESFIHALDTVGRTAACVDLEMLPSDGDFSNLRLAVVADGRRVVVRDGRRRIAVVDARTFAVSEPGEQAAAPEPVAPGPTRSAQPQRSTTSADGLGASAFVAAAAFAALAALAIALSWRRSVARG